MTTSIIKKVLAVHADLAIGHGLVLQQRGPLINFERKIELAFIFRSKDEIRGLDIAKYTRVRLYVEGPMPEYYYDADSALADDDDKVLKPQQIPSYSPGRWILVDTYADIIAHNDTTGIQGGEPGEYYHVTKDELDELLYHLDDTANPHFVLHSQLNDASDPNLHPMTSIIGLIADQDRQDQDIADLDTALTDHETDYTNPHQVTHSQLGGVTPDQHHNQVHLLYGPDHADVNTDNPATIRDILAFDGTGWQRGRRMNWRFDGWVEGNTYYKDDVVFGGNYTMIANTDDTIEYPFPQPVGDIAWAVFGDNAPAWEAQSTSTTRLLTGIKITPEEVAAVSGLRVWIPLLDPDVAYLLVTIVEDKVPQYQQLSPTDTGWWPVTFDTALLGTGVPVEIYLVTQGQGTTSTTFTHNWTYRLSSAGPNPNNPPTLGQFRHFSVNAPDIAYINKTDADGFSRKGDLDTLQAGDTIAWTDSGGVDVFFTLTADPVYYNSAIGDEDFYELNISPAVGQGSNGTAGMTFVHFLDRPTSYVRVANEFALTPNVRGLLSLTGNLADVVETVDAYGIDVLYQEVHFPVDWDVVSAIGTGGGGGGGSFTPNTFTGPGTTGYVPDPGTSQAYFLRDDGTWAEASGGTGDQNIDGGTADSIYTPPQNIDGGNASG